MSDTLDLKSANLLYPTKFQLSFGRIPTVQYFCQIVDIPDIDSPMATYPTATGTNLPIPGHKLNHTSLNVPFLVDEQLQNWNEIFVWMSGYTAVENTQQYGNLGRRPRVTTPNQPQYSDATVTILNAQNNPKIRMNFKRVFPISLSGLRFDSRSNPLDVMTCSASFAFAYMERELIG